MKLWKMTALILAVVIVVIGCVGLYLQNRKGGIDDFPNELEVRMRQYYWGLAMEKYSALAGGIYLIIIAIYGIRRFVRPKQG